jgi:two-component system cell cycle sensor histidine kinase/response regulator CckA
MLKAERTAIRTDRASLREGLTNLVLSFRYAMPEGSIVAVATRDVSVPPGPDAPAQPSVDYIVVEVTNTGRGASGELDWRLFEPSAIAPASGAILLALVILHDIVNYTGGFIEVASTASGATTVNLYLPLTSEI